MTTPLESLRAALVADAAVLAIVAQKIHFNKAPQGTLAPFIVCRVISDVPEDALVAGDAAPLSNRRVQVDCYAAVYGDAKALAAAVNSVLRQLSSSTGVACWRIGGRDVWDEESGLHGDSADFAVWA